VLLVVVVPQLALRDPDAAVRLSRYFSNNKARSAAYLNAAEAMTASSADDRLKVARAIPLGLARADAMNSVADAVLDDTKVANRVEQARGIAGLMPKEGPRWQIMQRIALELGMQDVRAGMRYAGEIERYTERIAAKRELLALLPADKVDVALELAGQEPSEEGRVDLIASLADRLAEQQPEAAVKLAEQLDHRPTREEILASAIQKLEPKNLERALELSGEIVTRSAARRAFPKVWLRALEAGKPPAQVWPLYRSLSHDPYSVRWVLREALKQDDLHPEEAMLDRTVQWMRRFPRSEWLDALKPHLGSEASRGMDVHFMSQLANRLANSSAEDAIALAELVKLDEYGWHGLAHTLMDTHQAEAEQAARHLREPLSRIEAWIGLLDSARKHHAPVDRLARELQSHIQMLAATARKEKTPAGRARGYTEVVAYLRRAKLSDEPYVSHARAEAAQVRDPLLRADILRSLEAVLATRPNPGG
jgi:hypothetical protein